MERLGEVLGTEVPGACHSEGTGSHLECLQSPDTCWNSNKMCSYLRDNPRWVTATIDPSTTNHIVLLIPIYLRGRQKVSTVDVHELLIRSLQVQVWETWMRQNVHGGHAKLLRKIVVNQLLARPKGCSSSGLALSQFRFFIGGHAAFSGRVKP